MYSPISIRVLDESDRSHASVFQPVLDVSQTSKGITFITVLPLLPTPAQASFVNTFTSGLHVVD